MSKRLSLKFQKPEPREREPENQMPTTAELDALRHFADLVERLGREPSQRELADSMSISQPMARKYVMQLARKGLLDEVKEEVVVGRQLNELGKRWLKQIEKHT